jgi:homoserine dehydrogenase
MKPVRLGLLGCGTVGGGVVRLLKTNAEYLTQSVGAPLEIARVLVRDGDRERVVPELDRALLTGDAEGLLGDRSIDIIVEVMGGVDPTKGFVERAIDSGKSVVTANKMLLAMHGPDLVARAVDRRVDLAFEASVGGGIPVIRVLREALAGDSVVKLEGIVNGTCNYVLTRMRNEGLGFDEVVRDAQAKGYAEADPTLDVDGHDAAHKLVVLAMMAFGARVDWQSVPTEGIRGIDPIDHRFAERFGFVIKHLAIGRQTPSGVELRVHPALVRRDTALANVNGVLNAIAIEGRALGPCLLSGRGAGDMPTAVSVVGDIRDVARAKLSGVPGLATRGIELRARPLSPIDDVRGRNYLRFQVHDRPGVLARLAGALGDAGVSIEQMVQEGRGGTTGQPVQIVILTHEAVERDVQRALSEIKRSGVAAHDARLLRIQE